MRKKTKKVFIFSAVSVLVLFLIMSFSGSFNKPFALLSTSPPESSLTLIGETNADVTYRMDFTITPTIKGTAFCNNENYYLLDQEVSFDTSTLNHFPKNMVFDEFFPAKDVKIVGINASENFCSPSPISRVLKTENLQAFCKSSNSGFFTCKFSAVLKATDEQGNPVVAVFYGLRGGSATFSIPKGNVQCSSNVICPVGFRCDLANHVCTPGEEDIKEPSFIDNIAAWLKRIWAIMRE